MSENIGDNPNYSPEEDEVANTLQLRYEEVFKGINEYIDQNPELPIESLLGVIDVMNKFKEEIKSVDNLFSQSQLEEKSEQIIRETSGNIWRSFYLILNSVYISSAIDIIGKKGVENYNVLSASMSALDDFLERLIDEKKELFGPISKENNSGIVMRMRMCSVKMLSMLEYTDIEDLYENLPLITRLHNQILHFFPFIIDDFINYAEERYVRPKTENGFFLLLSSMPLAVKAQYISMLLGKTLFGGNGPKIFIDRIKADLRSEIHDLYLEKFDSLLNQFSNTDAHKRFQRNIVDVQTSKEGIDESALSVIKEDMLAYVETIKVQIELFLVAVN